MRKSLKIRPNDVDFTTCYLCFERFECNEEDHDYINCEYYKMLPFHKDSCLLEAKSNTIKYQLAMDMCNHYQMFTYAGDAFHESVMKEVMREVKGKFVEVFKVFYYKSKLIAFIKTDSEFLKITSHYAAKDASSGDECITITLNEFRVYLNLLNESKKE